MFQYKKPLNYHSCEYRHKLLTRQLKKIKGVLTYSYTYILYLYYIKFQY